MDLLEKNSKIAIATTATIFALDFVLPEYSCIEKTSYKNFFLITTYLTVSLFLCDKGVEMWKEKKATSRSSPTLSSTLSESS